MKKIEVNNNANVTVMGVTFHGFEELRKYAVNREAKDGVYVGEDSERYPCFDSFDYAYENRRFWNFVFARTKEELNRKLEYLKNVDQRGKGCYNKLHDGTPEELLPMIYFGGNSHDSLEVSYSYTPQPINTDGIVLPEELTALAEQIAKNVHEVWSQGRINEGWTYGAERNDAEKKHPCLVPYEDLSESEKEYDRNTAQETLKLIVKLGFNISK